MLAGLYFTLRRVIFYCWPGCILYCLPGSVLLLTGHYFTVGHVFFCLTELNRVLLTTI